VRLLLIGIRYRLHATALTNEEERALAAATGVTDVGFRDDVETCLAAADVMVFPSQREGMPVCLMEALALGIPAITLNSRGCRDVVRDRIDGLVLPNANVDDLEAAVKVAVEDPALRQQWSTRALPDRERFDRTYFITAQKANYEAAAPAAHTESALTFAP